MFHGKAFAVLGVILGDAQDSFRGRNGQQWQMGTQHQADCGKPARFP